MSGYTTSISTIEDSYLKNLQRQIIPVWVVKKSNLKEKTKIINHIKDNHEKIREMLLNIPAKDFFQIILKGNHMKKYLS